MSQRSMYCPCIVVAVLTTQNCKTVTQLPSFWGVSQSAHSFQSRFLSMLTLRFNFNLQLSIRHKRYAQAGASPWSFDKGLGWWRCWFRCIKPISNLVICFYFYEDTRLLPVLKACAKNTYGNKKLYLLTYATKKKLSLLTKPIVLEISCILNVIIIGVFGRVSFSANLRP